MERRHFVQKMLVGLGLLLPGMQGCSSTSTAATVPAKKKLKGTKGLFLKLGTCSRTLFHIVNREFGVSMELEEKASDPLAGGILQRGHQCGMIWGASLATSAESYRRFGNNSIASEKAIRSSQNLVTSFSNQTQCVNCRDIIKCDASTGFGAFKCFVTGSFFGCFSLADNWAGEAVETANNALQAEGKYCINNERNCASEVAKMMGADEKETMMVAGFAGGLGLSGHACGALAAAVWLKTLKGMREDPDFELDKVSLLKAFYKESNSRILCSDICGRHFNSIADHENYLRGGGCKNLINALAQA